MPTNSISFDRAADYYDQTRAFAPGEERPATALFAKAGNLTHSSRVLEIGIGTGRIALPLSEYVGAVYGVDISRPMMQRLLAKRSAESVYPIEANGARLPLASTSFDAVVGVHIFHLIPEWRDVITEIARVLKPGALLLLGWDDRVDAVPRDVWSTPSASPAQSLGSVPWQQRQTFPLDLGWQYAGEPLTHAYTFYKSPQTTLEEIQNRVWSHTWRMTDAELDEGIAKVKAYIDATFADPSLPVAHDERFTVQAYRLPG